MVGNNKMVVGITLMMDNNKRVGSKVETIGITSTMMVWCKLVGSKVVTTGTISIQQVDVCKRAGYKVEKIGTTSIQQVDICKRDGYKVVTTCNK